MSTSIIDLLANTLHPQLQGQTQTEIQRARTQKGFITQLMITADDTSVNIAIRQSALVVLKNMVYDQCTRGEVINVQDWLILKSSVLQFLTRIWETKQLTNILREIIHLVAQKDYPHRWPEFLPQIINNIQNSGDFNTVASSVEALKAVSSVCGRSLQHEVTLNSMCNSFFVPLFTLANKLFQNYSPETLPILVSIFKTLNLSVFYHMPTILMNNIHQIMIFCKKILQLPCKDMEPLKIVTLKILVRLYSRHTTSRVPYKLISFAMDFHKKYSSIMVETFVMQLLNPDNSQEIINLSLKCLTCIYKNHDQSALIIDKHRRKLVDLCIQRFRVSGNFKSGQSVGSYITCLKEQRSQMVDFLTAVFSNNEGILGDLIQNLNSGDEKMQQIVLYVFGALGEQIEDYPQFHNNMVEFIISYILPILSGNNSSLLKARGCEVISAYPYLNLPGHNLQAIFQFIYSCLTESKEPYLNIYALEAFTHLIVKYEEFMRMIVPYLADILKVYTGLMRESNGQVYEVIKSFESFLGNLNGAQLQPFASDLIKFLTDLFYEYAESSKNSLRNNNDSSEDDDDDQDEDFYGACHGCIACIRQIISAQNFPQEILPQIQNSCILPLIIRLLQDKDLPHFEESLNILNMLLYKRDDCLPEAYNQFFLICAYSIVGIPQDLANSNLAPQYKNILVNVCVTPDQDIVSNIIGLFRNFIARLKGNLRNCKDQIGISFLQYLFKIVQHVNNSKNQNEELSYKDSDRWIIFTIYTSLLEHQILNESELSLLIDSAVSWYQNANNNGIGSRANLLLEILLMSLYYYPSQTLNKINLDWFLGEVLNRWETFIHQYQIQRLIIGVSKLMDIQALNNQNLASEIVCRLPSIVERFVQIKIKQNEEKPESDGIDLEEEAEEDLVAENTHLGLIPQNYSQDKREEQLRKEDDRQWEEEYNKYYYSPFGQIQELQYLRNVLGKSQYTNLLSGPDQQRLSQYLQNN